MLFRPLPLLLLCLTTPALISGCETTDKMLGAAERAVGSSTGRTVLDIVGGKDRVKSRGYESKITGVTLRRC